MALSEEKEDTQALFSEGSDDKNDQEDSLKKSPEKEDSHALLLEGSDGRNVQDDNLDELTEESEKEDSLALLSEGSDGRNDQNDSLDELAEESDLKNPDRRICVVTTAALPWRTGTAVNPLLRALYLTRGRPPHYVTLVVPWLQDKDAQTKLFGQFFETPAEQEAWIREYATNRAKCPTEAEALKVIFYKASYHKAFGSIFAIEDICELIPDDEADVAVLEEPEHLNWFRVPSPISFPTPSTSKLNLLPNAFTAADKSESETSERDVTDSNGDKKENLAVVESEELSDQEQRDKAELGWKYRFRHVVGILHTNYSAYMKQYGVGTSLIAAPAISILSSIVVKAYCHRVIRLSGVLPSLAPQKEVTCNVHGVRAEFLEPIEPVTVETVEDDNDSEELTVESPAAVYFIGKVIWAKGFDKLLEIEDLYRRETGSYFPIDVYGSGGDERAITRAFFGRRSPQQSDREGPGSSSEEASSSEDSITSADARAAAVFNDTGSLRERVYAAVSDRHLEQDGFEVAIAGSEIYANAGTEEKKQTGPLSILGDFSGKSLGTALTTSQAVYKLADAVVCHGLSMAITWDEDEKREAKQLKRKSSFIFDPPQSLHEWRLNPIPAKFLGVKDHALLKSVPQHKIFLNPSVTEVLCTTTAEALAMGKFVIIPKHPSNEFFLQFPNCLAYTSPKECVCKLQWAISHDPEPLTPELERVFTWEAATERLFAASGITKKEMLERENQNGNGRRTPLARLHVEFGKKGQFIGKLFTGDFEKGSDRETSTPPEEEVQA